MSALFKVILKYISNVYKKKKEIVSLEVSMHNGNVKKN